MRGCTETFHAGSRASCGQAEQAPCSPARGAQEEQNGHPGTPWSQTSKLNAKLGVRCDSTHNWHHRQEKDGTRGLRSGKPGRKPGECTKLFSVPGRSPLRVGDLMYASVPPGTGPP